MFTEIERRFLLKEFAAEGFPRMLDLRQIGCPAALFEELLEQRARKLRAKGIVMPREEAAPVTDLDAQIMGSRLF